MINPALAQPSLQHLVAARDPLPFSQFSVASLGPTSPYCASTVVLTYAEIRRFDGMPSMCQPLVARLRACLALAGERYPVFFDRYGLTHSPSLSEPIALDSSTP